MLRTFCLFLAFGLPFLLGYGVLPLPNFINEVAALLGLGFVLLMAGMEPARLRWNWRYGLVLAALALLLALTGWQGLRATTPGIRELYATTAGYLLVAGLAFHLGWRSGQAAATRERWVRHFCQAVALAALLAALGGLSQYLDLFHAWGLVPYLDTAGRAFGFVRQPNHQASFLAIGILCTGLLVARGDLRRDAGAVLALVMAAGVLATGSRMGLVLLVLECAWMLACFGPRLRRVVLFLAIAVPAVVALLWLLHLYGQLPFYGVAKVQQSMNEGAGVRTRMWLETVHLIAQAPWAGVGLHRYGQMFLLSDAAIHTGVIMSNAHNLLLQLAFDFGLPATAAVVAALACVLAGAWRARRDPHQALALGVVGCIGLHSLLEFPLWYLNFLAMGTFMLGLAGAASAPMPQAGAAGMTPPRSPDQPLLAACGALVVAMAVWLNHDYYRVSQLFYGQQVTDFGQALPRAEQATWWTRYVRFARLMLQPPDARNAADWLPRMRDAACQTLDPLYQPAFIVGLAHQGQVAQAKRLLYIHATLSPQAADQARAALARHEGPVFDELRRYLDQPTPVEVPPQDMLPCLR